MEVTVLLDVVSEYAENEQKHENAADYVKKDVHGSSSEFGKRAAVFRRSTNRSPLPSNNDADLIRYLRRAAVARDHLTFE